jgi:hypothetical protein
VNNELLYYLYIDEHVISLTFYPAYGMGGIGTQREKFEVSLSTIQMNNE